MKPAALLVPFLLLAVSCASEAWYEGFRAAERNECMAYTGTAYEECIQKLDMSYDTYRREREQVTGEGAE